MFDTEFEDVYLNHQFPKTDINFYMNANSSYLLEPWNKTSYKIRPESKLLKQRVISKTRNLSFDESSRRIRPSKKKCIQPIKNQITLSTLTFYLSVQNQNKPIERKKNVVSPILKSRRINHNSQQKVNKSPSDSIFVGQNMSNKGLTNTLRHHNLLKLKQERQNKMRQIINKKQFSNKKASVIKLNRLCNNGSYIDQQFSQQISTTNIVLSQQPLSINTHQYIKKPKKPSFVGIRKVMNINNINLQNRTQ